MPKTVYSERYKRFREDLIRRRKEAGLTQAQLARRLGKPQSYISKYETGERRLDLIEVMDIAMAIKFDLTAFIRKLNKP
jgi:transcriptional regulator with XRE-family HTH domain